MTGEPAPRRIEPHGDRHPPGARGDKGPASLRGPRQQPAFFQAM